MKKTIFIFALGFASLISAKELNFNLNKEISDNFYNKVSSVVNFSYLYQASCGYYFSVDSHISISDMTEGEYEEFWDRVVAQNVLTCINNTPKPITYFTSNK
mgnify:CR=1 FL=1